VALDDHFAESLSFHLTGLSATPDVTYQIFDQEDLLGKA
jgi:hypothetical protein